MLYGIKEQSVRSNKNKNKFINEITLVKIY